MGRTRPVPEAGLWRIDGCGSRAADSYPSGSHAHTLQFHWRERDWSFVAEPADELVDFIETIDEEEEELYAD